MLVHGADAVLRIGVASVSAEPKPFYGLGVILRHPIAIQVHATKNILRGGITLIGQRMQHLQRGRVVPALSILKWRGPRQRWAAA
jgi:hypothetical protein